MNAVREEQAMNPFNSGYFNEVDLRAAGIGAVGHNVQVARNCTIVGLENVEIGNNVRIDGYCSIFAGGRGWLKLGSYIHIGSYCHLSAGDGIQLQDFSGVSQGSRIYSRTDDFSGNFLTGPTVPSKYTGVICGAVTLGRHVIIGSGSVVLPKVTIGEGSAIGALSLVTKSLDAWGIYAGSPARLVKARSRKLLELEQRFAQERSGTPIGNAV